MSSALAGPNSGPRAGIAAEMAMEVATRMVEHGLSAVTNTLTSTGWGPAVDAVAMMGALESMAKTLNMDTVPVAEEGMKE